MSACPHYSGLAAAYFYVWLSPYSYDRTTYYRCYKHFEHCPIFRVLIKSGRPGNFKVFVNTYRHNILILYPNTAIDHSPFFTVILLYLQDNHL